MQVTISNRQRNRSVKVASLRAMASELSDAVCQNLTLRPAKHISASQIGKISKRAALSLVLLSNKGIHKLNKEWRGKDAETDVLSFPLNLEEPEEGVDWELGEIFISVEQAQKQASELGHSLGRELAFLFVHGLLHLLGFDHETKSDAKVMFQRQRDILEAAGYPRK
jgi:probable rRNA maturation factor